ncbi:MAG: hypothetical protein ABF306_16480 [Nocardioides marinisabuli]|uniref:hypothetical protein n=1 Tax=Nocardioides marinisabuli TaxID=419476 RepID=UPI00321967F6
MIGMVAGMLAADQVQHSVASKDLGAVLDPQGCGFGCSEGVDSEQVGQGPVVNGEV